MHIGIGPSGSNWSDKLPVSDRRTGSQPQLGPLSDPFRPDLISRADRPHPAASENATSPLSDVSGWQKMTHIGDLAVSRMNKLLTTVGLDI